MGMKSKGEIMKKKILVIDDERLIVKSLEKLLGRSGFDVVGVNTGLDAIMVAEETAIDLIVSDIKMPWSNGIDTIKELFDTLKSKNKNRPPVIFITGYADKKLEKQAKELNPVAYLHKPFDNQNLVKTIENTLK
jgi:CheY-like chemotaxis protein